jgi:pimeloyl-ACP methyl ester carboxylesterase
MTLKQKFINKNNLFIYIVIFVTILFFIKQTFFMIECKLIFLPNKLSVNYDYNLKFHETKLRQIHDHIDLEEINIVTKNEPKLNGILFNNPSKKYFFIYSHGNAGNISHLIKLIYGFANIGSIILYDYRGFGKSGGFPTENYVYKDLWRVFKFITHERNVKPENIIFYGASLGGSISAKIVSELSCKNIKIKGLIMQSSFSSLPDLVNDLYPKIFKYFLQSSFNTKKYVTKINQDIPILIAHSHQDELIGIHHNTTLRKNNKNIKFYELKGGHNLIIMDKFYTHRIKKFMDIK